MDTAGRVRAVGWIYTVVGTYALIGAIVSLFAPGEKWGGMLYIVSSKINVGVLFFPLGIGLLKQNALSRRIALLFSWLFVVIIGGFILNGIMLYFAGGEFVLEKQGSVRMGGTVLIIALSVIGLSLFVWQLRVLASKEVKNYFEQLVGRR